MDIQRLLMALEQAPLHIHHEDRLQSEQEITALVYDSRKAIPASLFIAVPGVHTDGRRYVGDAAQRGTIAAVGESLSGDQSDCSDLPIPYIEVANVRIAHANLAS